MYRVNGYARCTAIKMTGGLSYCLYIVVAITLHTASSSSSVYTDINNFTDTDSKPFRPNMETSNFKNSAYWLDNDKSKSQKQVKYPKRPFWETSVLQNRKNDDPNQRDVEEWENMMRKVTDEQLKKWETKYNAEKNAMHKDKIDGDMKNMLNDETELRLNFPKHLVNTDSKNSGMSLIEKTKNLGASARAQLFHRFSEMDIPKMKWIGNLLNYQSDRWGMSGPPNKLLEEISQNDTENLQQNMNESPDEGTNNYDSFYDTNNNVESRFLPNSTNIASKKHLKSKKSRHHKSKHLHKSTINDSTTKRPILSSTTVTSEPLENEESLTKTMHLNEMNPNGNNAINETTIDVTAGKSKIFAPIFIFGPTMWIAKLPKTIKQKLKIHRAMKLLNRIQPTQTNGDDNIPSKNSAEHDDGDFSGIYEFL